MTNSDNTIIPLNTDYASFYKGYVEGVIPGSLEEIFSQDKSSRQEHFDAFKVSENLSAYAPGKWSVKELLQHCIDTERIFAVRALMIARGEPKEIPGYDQDQYAANSQADERNIESLRLEWEMVRQTTISLFESFQKSDFEKIGIANGSNLAVRAIPYIMVGHALHHFQVLREKYGFEF